MDDEQLVRKLRWLAHHIEDPDKVLTLYGAQENVEERRLASRIFEYWKKRMNKPKNTKLTTGRRRVIRARLAEGYTANQLLKAIEACSASAFHMGENDRKTAYNDLTLIFRSGEKLESFLEMAGEQDPHHSESPAIRRLKEQAAEALKRGDTSAYNNANARISAARTAAVE
jgi:hypothetical protein